MRKYLKYCYSALIALGIIALDQVTKLLAQNYLPNPNEERLKIIKNFFYLIEVHNTGAAWGMFKGSTLMLVLVPLIALVIFFYLISKSNFKTMKFYSVGISLMIGGTIGNLIDRVFRGYVIDFLDFDIFGYSYPTFNVADMALVIGVIMFAIDILFLETRRNKRND
ncbi:MAG: signal peptidase II [Acholeplasmatales bacterium]|jgi:signal peptidase II|nr:signal peptidase II [Acholeplasmataceae bacterium]MDY0115740.1 signal peptidase II [Acholeplasmatales bacterium]MCK9234325.1 signal peptidase II [Acholeplasmataceae bacterium]MCK9289243.1 signal peptidase II [Acholeplasmataceae bacterium]MCK9427651.1 signal peptidase II [Acholeplasmataceae bacterium]